MSQESTTKSSSIGLTSILTIIFVIAKITGYITWSWWWVFAPIWISLLVLIAILLFVLAVMIVTEAL